MCQDPNSAFILKLDNSLQGEATNLISVLQRKLGLEESELCVQDHTAGGTRMLSGRTAGTYSFARRLQLLCNPQPERQPSVTPQSRNASCQT